MAAEKVPDLYHLLWILGRTNDIIVPIQDLFPGHEHNTLMLLHIIKKHIDVFDSVGRP